MRGRWVKRGEVEGGDEVGRGKGYSGKGEGGGGMMPRMRDYPEISDLS